MKKNALKLIVILFICNLSINLTIAQPSKFSANKYINTQGGDSLNYRLLYPDYNSSRKYPLVIFLHGSGERGNDNDSQLKWGVMNFARDQTMKMHPAFVIAPQCPENMEWASIVENDKTNEIRLLATPTKAMKLVIQLIHQLIIEFPIDTNRIYITGVSMGGYGTFDAIQRYPHLFAAAVPVCGGGDISKATAIAHIPIWIFHGAEDPAVNPQLSLNMVLALTKAGAHPGFTQYPEVGHFSWIAAYSDPLMIEWMFRQHK